MAKHRFNRIIMNKKIHGLIYKTKLLKKENHFLELNPLFEPSFSILSKTNWIKTRNCHSFRLFKDCSRLNEFQTIITTTAKNHINWLSFLPYNCTNVPGYSKVTKLKIHKLFHISNFQFQDQSAFDCSNVLFSIFFRATFFPGSIVAFN